VELIRAAGGTAATAFRLTQPVLQGGFQYLLETAAAGGGQTGFFLQSTVREELFASAIAVAASRSTVRALAFADRGIEAAEGIGSRLRAWLTVHGGVEQNGLDSGARFDQDFWGVTAGIDSGFTPNVRLGLQAGYGQTDADIFLRQGASKLEGDTWFAQVYGQYLSGPWFADASIGYASTEWDFSRAVLAPGLTAQAGETVDGVIGKIGGGYRFSFDEPFFVTVSGHVLYDGGSCGGGCFLAGIQEDTSDWAGRLAVRFERPFMDGAIRPYLAVSYTDDFSGGHTSRLGQAGVVIDSNSSVLGLNAGLNYSVSPNAQFFLDVGARQSLNNDTEAYQGQAGFRMTW
jgi:outer membrane autotransporter protein